MEEIIKNLKKEFNLNKNHIFEITSYNKKWKDEFTKTKKEYFSKLKIQKGFKINKEIEENILINIWNSIEEFEESFNNIDLIQSLSNFTDTFETVKYEVIEK